MDDCIFCKIIRGEIPTNKIYEDEKTLAFLDISKDLYGHTLVIPKHHFRNILDCQQDYLDAVIDTVQKVSKHYVDNCGFDGVNFLSANERCAEQSIFHLHVHILPRKNNDGLHTYPELEKHEMDLQEISNKLKIK